jgi:hypothetical protein
MSTVEIIGFALWVAADFALSLAATLIIVHRAVRLPEGQTLSGQFLTGWALTWGGSMLLLSILARALVFRRTTPWDVVLTWPWAVGPAVGVGCFVALTGQMESGSRLCDAPGGPCDTSWGIGAMLVSVAAAVFFGGAFVAVASLKRMLLGRG